MAEVVIYTTNTCGYCYAAKSLFDRKGVAYAEVDVSDDDAKRAWLVEATGRRTVPQIFIDGTPVGGFTDVRDLERAGKLDPLLGR